MMDRNPLEALMVLHRDGKPDFRVTYKVPHDEVETFKNRFNRHGEYEWVNVGNVWNWNGAYGLLGPL